MIKPMDIKEKIIKGLNIHSDTAEFIYFDNEDKKKMNQLRLIFCTTFNIICFT